VQLDFQQQQAVETESWRAMVIAGAGSGKTRVLTERVAHLVENCKVSPSEIMVMTFTRKAAGEMQSRLEERIGNSAFGLILGTMHALALRMINRFGEVIGLKSRKVTIYSEWEESYLLRDVALEMGLYDGKKWKGMKAGDVMSVLGGYYQRGVEPEDSDPVHDIFRAFIQRCRENNAMTYGGLMVGLRLLIPTMAKYLNIKHILVDEVQDIDHLQWDIILEMEKQFGAALFVVGDVDQCQPAGTMVLTPEGYKPIESLVEGAKVRSWSRRWHYVQAAGPQCSRIRVSSRPYTGTITTVDAGGHKTAATNNHRWLVRWGDSAKELYCVYMMEKYIDGVGKCYRVGWCKVINDTAHGKIAHYKQRARIETADAIWILKVTKDKAEASAWESIISVKYGLPTIMFTPKKSTPLYSEGNLKLIWRHCCDKSKEGFHGVHAAFQIDENYPIWSAKQTERERPGSRRTLFETTSKNLFEGMEVPVWDGEKGYSWVPITITRERAINIEVYSLDVSVNHSYIADGICTLNSIYEWRGAAPKYLVDHQDEFWIYRLDSNYRSVPSIVEASNKLISHNQDRITKTMVATREAGSVKGIIVQKEYDSEALAGLLSTVNPIEFPEGIAVLGRVHYLLEKLSRLLEEKGVKHEYIGRTTALTNSEPFRRYHAFLKLAINPYDNFSFLLIKDIVGLGRAEYSEIRVKAAEEGLSHFQVWLRRAQGGLISLYDADLSLAETVSWLDTLYPSLSPEASAFVYAWEKEHPDRIEDYLNWLALWDLQDEIKKEAAGISLMTGHACKGLQFPVVIIAGANEEIIPSKQSIAKGDIESERRLFYVMITRAQDQLIVTCRPEHVEKEGRIYESPASRFIAEALP